MRLLHTSDTHLGHQQFGRTNEHGINQREADIAASFLAVVDAAIANPPDVFIHAGDLFDGVRPSNRALATALDGFLRLSQAGIDTVVIAGNHEHPKLRATGSPFRILAHLPHIHMVYRGKAESFDIGGVRIHAVPQCADAKSLAAAVATLEKADKNILILHGAVHSVQAFRNAEFNEQTLDPSWFAGFDYVALGHYHNTQEILPNAWYCGSSDRVSIAEAGQPKGFLEVELDPLRVDFAEVATRPYADLPIVQAAGLTASEIVEAAAAAAAGVPDGAVARLRIHNLDADLRGTLDQAKLRALGARLLHLDIKLQFADQEHDVAGLAEFGGLADEFAAYVKERPIEGDRDALLALARRVMEEA